MLERWLAAVLLVGGLFLGATLWQSANVPHEEPLLDDTPEEGGGDLAPPARSAPAEPVKTEDRHEDEDDDDDDDRKERKGKGKRGKDD